MSGQSQERNNIIFRAKTKEAWVIKSLAELLSNASIKFAPFRIDADGIHLSQADANSHQLINFTLHRENFGASWKLVKPLNFLINSNTFYKLLKSIKKKDHITLFINGDNDCKLGICVETTDEENDKTYTHIRITYNQPQIFKEPAGYPSPTIVTNKEFQKMKNLHAIDKVMRVTCNFPGCVKFFCDGKDVYEREVILGNENPEDDYDAKDDSFKEYHQTFTTSYITSLTKCAKAGNVQIFVHNDLPLKINMKTGNLGDLTVLIKSRERIELEKKVEQEKRLQQQLTDTEAAE